MSKINIHFKGQTLETSENETVLSTLIRHQHPVPFSCQNGICHTCMLKCTKGHIPQEAQNGIKDTLVNDGYFLACACKPSEDLYITLPDESALFSKATVLEKNRLAPHIYQILLDPVTPLYYHAGQFINLHRQDGLSRSYSLASHPQQDRVLEIHVGRHSQGQMSHWIFDEFKEGDCIDIQGPNGGCYYLANKQEMPLLLIGTGTGNVISCFPYLMRALNTQRSL